MPTVADVLAELTAGRATLAETAARLGETLEPVHRPPRVTSATERYRREFADTIPPHTPGSWDDVRSAYLAGEITGRQYYALFRQVRRPTANTTRSE